MRNYLLKSSEALPKSQGGVFAKKNTIRATLHPTLHTLPRATRYAATLLLLLCLGVGNAWGTASTSSDSKSISGTVTFDGVGTISNTTCYWYNGVKFFENATGTTDVGTQAWSTGVTYPCYAANIVTGKDGTAKNNKWGNSGGNTPVWSMSGLVLQRHCLAVHVNSAGTITLIINNNTNTDVDVIPNLVAKIDDVAYGTAYTKDNYLTGTGDALTLSSSRADATNKKCRYTVTYTVSESDLTDGEAVVKFYYGSSGTGAGKLFCYESVSFTPTPSCTAPNHVDISGAWDRFGGETISLTATAYSSAGTGSPIADANITGWQWQKYYNSTWNNVSNGTSDGVTISGATTKNLQISNCSYNNSGSYRCVVSTGATCSTASDGRQVKVYVLECYNGGTTVYNFTRTGSSQAGTLTIDLSASTAYTFKVHADNEYFGNHGTVNEDVTNWVMCNSGDAVCSTNLTVNSGLGGTFTFGIDYSTGGSSNVEGEPEISVTYPRKRIYLSPGVWDADDAKFAYYYFRTSGGSGWTDFLTEDDCGMYADIPQWNGVKINAVRLNKTTESTGSWGDKWNQTSDITITSNDYVEITGWGSGDSPYDYDSDYSTPTYTISYNTGSTTHTGGNSISGSKSNQTKTCGVDFTLPSSAIFTTTGYTQDGWATSDGGSKDYNLGGSYTTNAAATFYPHWSINTYTLTASATVINAMTEDSKTGAITGSFTNNPISSVPYGTSTSTSSNTFTANGTTVTAAATIAGTSAQCDECTYRFDSWENIPATVTADVNTIHAKYNTTYSITYNKDGGSWAGGYSAPAYYVYGTGATLPTGSNITKEHYSFDGWTLSGSTPDLVNGWGNVTLDANWTPNTYNVDFSFSNASRSSGDEEGTDAATYGEDFEVVVAATSGYALPSSITVTIGGDEVTEDKEYTWDKSTGTVTIDGDYITGAIVIEITAEVDVTTYSVTYAAGVTLTNGSAPAGVTDLSNGDKVTVAGNTGEMVYGSNVFRGWTDGTTFYQAGDKITISSADVALTAVWDGGLSCETLAQGTQNAEHNAITATVGTITTTGGQASEEYIKLSGSSSQCFTVTAKAGYTIAAGDKLTMTVYNKANSADNIGFQINSTSHTASIASKSEGQVIYTLLSTDISDGTVTIKRNDSKDRYHAILLERCTKSNFTVSFADQTGFAGSSTLPDDIVGVPTGKKVLQPSDPTAAGYTFGGWYSNAACTAGNEIDWDEMTITADKTIYAKWTEKSTPTSYTLSAAASSVCSGNSTTINLSGSQSGITYELYEGESKLREVAGTGSALSLGATSDLTMSKTYSVKTVENATYKAITMASTVTVSINAAAHISANPTSPINVVVDNATSITGLTATGYSLSYQWYTCASGGGSATAITAAGTESYSGYTSATLGLTPTTTGAKYFKCIVTDGCGGSAISNVVTVNVSNAMHSVSAVTSTGDNTYGSVSSAAASVAEGSTTTITASPATGYQVTNWAVSGEGASIDPSGASNANSTTLTMGTANATVTVTFGAKTYSVTLDRGNGTGGSGSVTMTYNSSSHSAITAPTAPTGYTFAGWYTGAGGTGAMVMNASGTLQASVAGYTDGSGNWTKNATCTLYAKYTANYPSGYLYITDVMATPETGATASATDASFDASLDGSFSHSGLAHWARASAKSSGVYTLTFASPITAGATAAGVAVDVWWGVDNTSNASTYIYLNGTSDSDEIGHYKSNGESQRKTLLEQLKNVQKVGTTSVSSLQLKCNDNPGSTWFRVGIKEIPGYQLTYNANEGSGAPSASYQPNATITLSSTVPTRTGYRFLGWNTEDDGSGTRYASGASFTMPSTATTLYAEWQEAATLEWLPNVNTAESSIGTNSKTSTNTTRIPTSNMSNIGNYGSLTITSNAKENLTSKIAAPTSYDAGKYMYVTFTVPSGYEFVPSSVAVKVQPVGAVGDVKLELCDASGHSITKTQSSVAKGSITTVTMPNGSSVAFKGTVTLKIYCYGASTGTYRLGSPIAISGDINELEGYTVTYADGGATSGSVPVDASSPYAEGATVTVLGNTGSLAKDGYAFGGWSDGASTYSAGDEIADISDDITLTAVWTPNDYTITYHLNGASWASSAGVAEYTVGTGATLPLAGAMTNVGYTFNGWYANSNLSTGGVVTSISTSDYGDKEYWAKWTEVSYTITYDANNGSATGSTSSTVGHYVTVADCGFELDDNIFMGWNTASNGSGASYAAGEEIELTANMTLYAQWASDYSITWGNVQIGGAGATVTPNVGGGNYTITANTGSWTGSLDASMVSSETSGVSITNVVVDNSGSPKTITVTFAVGAEVVGESIGLTLSVPAAGVYGAKESTKAITIDRCTGSSSGSDGVLFSAEFKDSGLGTGNICDAANTPVTFTTDQLKAAAVGGSIKAYTTSDLTHVKYVDNGVYLKGTNGVIQIDLDNAINTNDLFEYVNVHSSNPSAYLRHTSASNTTDQIVLTGYGSRNVKVMLPAAFNGKTTLYIVKNSTDFKLHKAAVVRPAFLMLVDDEASTGNLEGTDVELTTSSYLSIMKGGHVYYTSPSSGDLKITQNSSKNYITFAKTAGYLKVVLNDALQEGDVIGYDTHSASSEICFTTTTTRSTDEHTSSQLYTVGSSSPLKGQTTFYIWYYSSSTPLRGLQIARSGVAGGSGGSDKITPTLSWSNGQEDGAEVDKNEGDPDFTISANTTSNTLGTITYSSSDESAATVNASGRVHIVGAGTPTITATLAASGCYEEKSITYTINIYAPACEDPFPTITTKDLGCDGVELSVPSGSSSYQWYQNGVSMGGSYVAAKCTVTVAGEYYVEVTNTCARASNTVTVEAKESVTATKIVNSWYVKNGRRTPDIALVQTENATGFYVKIGDDKIWDEANSVTTGFGGCGFYLGEDGIIYLKGQKNDGTAPSGLDANKTLKITATGCGGDADELSINIKWQDETDRPSVAFVSLGTEKGAFTDTTANYYKTTPLYKYLDYTLGGGAFDLTAQNIYSTVDEQALREHYSQFDAILITDDPNTGKKKDGKSYVDAMGALIDIRPMLTMEAFVSKLANWKAKGINGNPSSPNPRQYGMKLECKDHEIFADLNSASSNVDIKRIDGIDYWTVLMVDSTKSPYSGVAYNASTSDKPALQGFSASDVSGLLLLGEISAGTLYAGVERQDEPAARLMLLGLNNKALPNALTDEGKKVIANALKYLLKTNMEDVDDCSNYFTGAAGTTNWNTAENWSKSAVPNSPTTKVRILKPCVVSGGTFQVASVDIATSGKSGKGDGVANCTGSLTINADGALIVGGKIRTAVAPNFNSADLMPTTVNDLVINTNSTAQACLIMNNDAGDTKATVNLYSLGRNDGSYQFQYMAIPMSYVPVNPSFAGAGIYTYVWQESSNGWERRGYYTDLYAFEGVGITTTAATASNYQMKGSLAPTTTKEIALTRDNKGLNLVGNSWTAPIQISKLSEDNTDDNIEKVVYIYSTGYDAEDGALSGGTETAGQWLAIPFNAAGFEAWGGLKVIPSMQAFQVKVKKGGATLTLDYDKVVRGDNQALNAYLRAPKRTTEPSDIVLTRLRIADTKTHTDLYLFEGEQFSDAYDNGWEANFRAGDGRSAMLYARTAAGVMAVAALPELEGTQVFFIPGKETEYTFTFTGGDDTYYLNDIKEQKSTLINEANSYTFRYESGDAANRFIISRTPFEAPSVTTGITDLDVETPKAIKVIYNDKLYIIRGGRVYSADGSLVK